MSDTGPTDAALTRPADANTWLDALTRGVAPGDYRTLGTDGWGRSDGREKLRKFFEVDRTFIYVAAISALADAGEIERSKVSEAIVKHGIDPDRPGARQR